MWRIVLVLVAACATLASERRDAGERNDRSYAAAFGRWRAHHPGAREIQGERVVMGVATLEPATMVGADGAPHALAAGLQVDPASHQLVIQSEGCGGSCTPCDPATLPSDRVFAMPDGAIRVLHATPKVHVRHLGTACEPSCGESMDVVVPPTRYPVTMPARIEVDDISYPHEVVEPETHPCNTLDPPRAQRGS